jgi:hypothetical protein
LQVKSIAICPQPSLALVTTINYRRCRVYIADHSDQVDFTYLS